MRYACTSVGLPDTLKVHFADILSSIGASGSKPVRIAAKEM
jgi:hypothetical protein